MDYEIDLSTLNNKKTNLNTLKKDSEDAYSEFNSNFSGLSGTELGAMYTSLEASVQRLKTGGANSKSWFEEYITAITNLEEELAALDSVNLAEINEFKGKFEDMFGRVTMPVLKTGGDIHALAMPKMVIHNGDKLIISNESGYVFPFAEGVSAPITSHVGIRNNPFGGSGTEGHNGTDIGVPYGTEVYAVGGGTVINAGRGDAGGFGNWVRIQQDDGNVVIYGHVSKSDYYSVGDRVEAGDLIANVGSEGRSTGPHLHLEMHDADGNLLDSENYFSDCWPG